MSGTVDCTPPLGFDAGRDSCLMINNTGSTVAAGDVLAIDYTGVGSATGLWFRMKTPATADLASGIFGVATAAMGIGETGLFLFTGDIGAKILTTAVAVGDRLIATNAAVSLSESAAEAASGFFKIIAIAKVANTVANTVGLVQFSGIDGFGYAGA